MNKITKSRDLPFVTILYDVGSPFHTFLLIYAYNITKYASIIHNSHNESNGKLLCDHKITAIKYNNHSFKDGTS